MIHQYESVIDQVLDIAQDSARREYARLEEQGLASENVLGALATYLNISLSDSEVPITVEERNTLACLEVKADPDYSLRAKTIAAHVGKTITRSSINFARLNFLHHGDQE